MKRFSEQLHTKATSVKLRAAERRELRERVVSYMEYHPLPKELKAAKPVLSPLQTEAFTMVRIPFAMLAKWSAATAVLLLVVIPVMAERAVPGDGLYAVKVSFNEELRGTLANTPYEKIEWETEKLNRRIAEARLLASEGRLTEEVEAEVAQAVKQHTENAQREIAVLRAEDEDEATLAAITFNTTLEVQSAAFREESEDTELFGDDSKTSAPKLLASVLDETLSIHAASNASSTLPAYEKLIARVETNTTRARELLATIEGSADPATAQDVIRRIEDIERQIQEAMVVREEDDSTARKILVDSLQRTQKLIVLMTEIEVSQEVTVEEIVPVILTPQEKSAEIERYTSELQEGSDEIRVMLSETTNLKTNVIEKVNVSLQEIDTALEIVSSTTDFGVAKEAAEGGLELISDTKKLLETQRETGAGVIEEVASTSEEVAAPPGAEGIVAEISDPIPEPLDELVLEGVQESQ